MHRGATIVFSIAMVVIGVALAVQSVAAHGGLVISRLLLGALFIAGGSLRIWVERRRGPQP